MDENDSRSCYRFASSMATVVLGFNITTSLDDKIQATVRKTLVYKFGDLLKEGHVYKFSSFGVVPNTGSYRATNHEHRLVFQMWTTVQEA
ncbi:hypothetical protein RIF29_14912 [Crotalaria pallida]|uniref:Replication protein A 70 kDa DNA-binding subunit B/D first OB fold domain-containing protein n=1 Tax=Crotalaria pallida TaxID=3830 RepID=A0AAN9IAR1_CROPI